MAITNFVGKYRFLSNFYELDEPILYDGLYYSTTEHAYQAAKSSDKTYRRLIQACETPGQAKKYGKSATLRRDWEDVKVLVMREVLQKKFYRGGVLAGKLFDTKDNLLVEGNTWGDVFWGQCPVGNGENWLGRLLMEVRDDLQY